MEVIEGVTMQNRTLLLFAVMLVLFAFYATMSLQAVPDVQTGLKEQAALLNNLDEEVNTKATHN